MGLDVCSCATEGDTGSPRSRFSGNVLDGIRSVYRVAVGHSGTRRLAAIVLKKRFASGTDTTQTDPEKVS